MTLTAKMICENPFRLGLPDSATPIRAEINAQAAKLLAQWQGTIAATMKRQAQEEGHKAVSGHSTRKPVDRSPEIKRLMDLLADGQWYTRPEVAQAIGLGKNASDMVVRLCLAQGLAKDHREKSARAYIAIADARPFTRFASLEARVLDHLDANGPQSVRQILAGTKSAHKTLRHVLLNMEADGILSAKRKHQAMVWSRVKS